MLRPSTSIIAGACLLFTLSLGLAANPLTELKATLQQDLPPPPASVGAQAVVPASEAFRMPNLWSETHSSCDPDFVIAPPPGRYFILNLYPQPGGTTTSWSPDQQPRPLRQPNHEHLSTTESRLLNWSHDQSHLQGCRR